MKLQQAHSTHIDKKAGSKVRLFYGSEAYGFKSVLNHINKLCMMRKLFKLSIYA